MFLRNVFLTFATDGKKSPKGLGCFAPVFAGFRTVLDAFWGLLGVWGAILYQLSIHGALVQLHCIPAQLHAIAKVLPHTPLAGGSAIFCAPWRGRDGDATGRSTETGRDGDGRDGTGRDHQRCLANDSASPMTPPPQRLASP